MTPFPIPLTTPPDTRIYLVIVEVVSAEVKFCVLSKNCLRPFYLSSGQTRQNNATRRAFAEGACLVPAARRLASGLSSDMGSVMAFAAPLLLRLYNHLTA